MLLGADIMMMIATHSRRFDMYRGHARLSPSMKPYVLTMHTYFLAALFIFCHIPFLFAQNLSVPESWRVRLLIVVVSDSEFFVHLIILDVDRTHQYRSLGMSEFTLRNGLSTRQTVITIGSLGIITSMDLEAVSGRYDLVSSACTQMLSGLFPLVDNSQDASWTLALLSAYSVKYVAMHDLIAQTAVYQEFVMDIMNNAINSDSDVVFGSQM